MGKKRRHRVVPTDDWEQLKPLCGWPEQVSYEEIRPVVLFGSSVAQRTEETGTAQRTLYRRVKRFEAEGMDSLFSTERAKRFGLPPAIRRFIVDLKAEHPPMRPNEVANICYVRFGRHPDGRTVARVLQEEPIPLRMVRRYPPYHEIPEAKERRMAIVRLHAEGWNVKSIASYLKTYRSTVYRTLRRFIEEGLEGLEDKPKKKGAGGGVRKVDLKAIAAVRRLQQNPELGEFRIHAALKQMGIHLSPRTCGRVLALNRRLYALDKPKKGSHQKRRMPFASSRRHEYWSADIRYVDHRLPLEGNVYVISVLENHSRAILSSMLSRSQDLSAYLSVLYAAVERYGSPEALLTDGGAVFRAKQALSIYEALNIRKAELERGKPWQSYIETTFNVQRRIADFHFAKAESWSELVAAHERWVADYNEQSHWAHRERPDGRRSPSEVLGWVTEVRYREEDLRRAFFSTRFSRTLDSLGYARFRHWRIYGEEGLARREAALWLGSESLTLEYAGEPLSCYQVEYEPGSSGRLVAIRQPTLYETSHRLAQLRLLELGDEEWLKALKLEDYAPRRPRKPQALQQALFTYTEAI